MNLQQYDIFFFSIKSFISRDTAFYNPTVRADHPVLGVFSNWQSATKKGNILQWTDDMEEWTDI